MNTMTNGGKFSVDSNALAGEKRGVIVGSGDEATANDIESRMLDQDATVTITRSEWQKLMSMLQSLSANQAELCKNQAELLSQLSRANERVKELEERNAQLSVDQMTTKVCEKNGQGKSTPRALSRANSFQYISKRVNSTPNGEQSPKDLSENAQAPQKTIGARVQLGGNEGHLKSVVQSPRKTWAQIAAAPRPSIKDVTPQTQESLRKCLAMLDISSPEPKPTAVYFRNIKRSRLGQVRKALKQMFTHPWAILGLSFIGKSVIEIVCHQGLADQVVAKLRLIGATHIKNMDVFGDNLKKLQNREGANRNTLNLERAQQRFERLVSTCINSAAKAWYSKQAAEAERRLAEIYNLAHDVETSVSNDSGYDSNEVEVEVEGDVAMKTREIPMDTPAEPKGITSSGTDIDEDLEEIQSVGKETDLAREAPPQL